MTPPDSHRDDCVPSAPAPLSLRLLGPFEARVHGEPLPRLRSRKGQWLLALLALRQGREVQREWLAEALWPETRADGALTNLRQSLADLRRAFSDQSWRLQTPSTRTVRLDLSGADVDLVAFDEAAGRPERTSLERAVTLYRGPLLEGWAEPWIGAEREDREQRYLHVLEALAEVAVAEGEPRQAIEYLRLASAVDPLRQEIHRALIRLHDELGEYEAVVQVYLDLSRRLHEELNVEPYPETRALYQEVRERARRRARQPPPTAGPPAERPSSGAATQSARLPAPLTALVGREEELRELHLRLGAARLLTLTGPGGSGKTRLALELAREAAAEYADGACFVDLAESRDAAAVAGEIARALGLQLDGPPENGLASALRGRRILLLLDNCEQVVAPCAGLVAALLRECAGLRVLATSRERLGLTGEAVWRVPPLETPPVEASAAAPQALLRYPAAALFAARAAAARPDFQVTSANAPAVASICRRLDGLPLALELAAARVESLSAEEILARLEADTGLLASADPSLPERHRTLHAAIEASHEGLSERDRYLFRSLSVFAGGAALDAVDAVCAPGEPHGEPHGAARASRMSHQGSQSAIRNPPRAGPQGLRQSAIDALARLVRKSLVVPEEADGRTRYRLLETIREYAAEKLEASGEPEVVRRRHLAHYARLAERAADGLTGAEQVTWLRRLDDESENLRAALRWGLGTKCGSVGVWECGSSRATEAPRAGGDSSLALRLAAALGRYWQIRGAFAEGREWLRRALVECPAATRVRARALAWAGFLAAYQGEYDAARELAAEGLALARELADARLTAAAQSCLALVEAHTGNAAAAEAGFAVSLELAREAGDAPEVASTLGYLGILAASRGDSAQAAGFYDESLKLRRRMGDRWGIAACLNNRGLLARREGRLEEARAYLEQSLAIRRELGDRRCIAVTLNSLGALALAAGRHGEARGLMVESLGFAESLGDRRSIAYSLEALARLEIASERWERAARLFGAAAALRHSIGAALPASEAQELEADRARVEAGLGQAAFDRAWQESAEAPLEEAVAVAQGRAAGETMP